MRKLFIIAFGLLTLSSCGDLPKEKTEKTTETTTSQADTTSPSDLTFKILKENVNDSISKCNLDIELNRKVSEQELTNLANKLRGTRTKYDKVWIFYTLPKMKVGSGAWATTHFTPTLEVKILGSTDKEESNSNNAVNNVDGKQIGKWYEQQATSATYLYYEKDNKFFMKTIFKDGTSMEVKMNQKKVRNGLQLTDPEDTHGEYYIISKSGELEFYNKDNKKFGIAQVIK
jgi:hypothetical protein